MEIHTRPLLTLRLTTAAPQPVGDTPAGRRLVVAVTGGSFEGERLRGRVLPGGSDWITVRTDGTFALDVRLVLATDDEALISLGYRGLRHGPAAVLAALGRGETVDPASYYMRVTASFETAAPAYDWLNRIVVVGTGQRPPDGPIYTLFEVL